jgi:hypothetical protein
MGVQPLQEILCLRKKKICVLHMTSPVRRKTTFNSAGKEEENLTAFYISRPGKISYIAGIVC